MTKKHLFETLADLRDEKPPEEARPGKAPAWLRKATASTFIHDFRKYYQELPEMGLFEQLSTAITYHYFEDPCKPGIMTSCLEAEEGKRWYYVAVQRYPSGSMERKKTECTARAGSMYQALRDLAGIWLEQIKYDGKTVEIRRPPGPEADELIEQLQASLDLLEKEGEDV